ncbi:unnamed protein product [marine sediment metagenome]|uniref:Uncharacterized protein n=1 Tax=marine sediment metagenome TaxID=412755 RepID=X0ZKX8_9ZZZZ
MQLPEYFQFQCRTKVIFGASTIKELPNEIKLLGSKRAFIVTDKVVRNLDFFKKIEDILKSSKVELVGIFDEVPVNSDIEVCNKGYKMAREKESDILIAVGGGSVIDTAKGMNLLLSEGGDLMEDHQGAYLLERPLKNLITIPTTAGTGSEVTFAAVIRDSNQKLKVSFISPYISPNTAILDPEVTISCPPELTASTGMDALTHAIESIHSLQNEPITDALAIHAIKLIGGNLREAVNNGENIEARGNMLIAANIPTNSTFEDFRISSIFLKKSKFLTTLSVTIKALLLPSNFISFGNSFIVLAPNITFVLH